MRDHSVLLCFLLLAGALRASANPFGDTSNVRLDDCRVENGGPHVSRNFFRPVQ